MTEMEITPIWDQWLFYPFATLRIRPCCPAPVQYDTITDVIVTSCTAPVQPVSASLSAHSDSGTHPVTLPPWLMLSAGLPPGSSTHSTQPLCQMPSSVNLHKMVMKQVVNTATIISPINKDIPGSCLIPI